MIISLALGCLASLVVCIALSIVLVVRDQLACGETDEAARAEEKAMRRYMEEGS